MNKDKDKDKYKLQIYAVSAIQLSILKGSALLITVVLMMVIFSANPIQAQLTTTTQKPPATAPAPRTSPTVAPEVVLSLFGVNKSIGTVVAYVTAKSGTQNVTKGVVDDAMVLDMKDGRVDGVAQIFFRFGNSTMAVGSTIKACAVVIKDLSIVCSTAQKAPDPRTDIQLDLHSATGLKKIT